MRLADIAKELRITTQELRRELGKTNFGISATAHEVDDGLATGVIRFLKGKVKPTLTHKRVAVVFKDEKEVKPKPKKRKVVTKKSAKKKEDDLTGTEQEKAEESSDSAVESRDLEPKSAVDRARVPKNIPEAKGREGGNVSVSRRIEVGAGKGSDIKKENLPKPYYKPK